MEDAWEVTVDLNVGTQDPNGDLDGNGRTNIEDFAACLFCTATIARGCGS